MPPDGISGTTSYKWRSKFGGMNVPDTKRLRQVEEKNAQLRTLVAKQDLDNVVLKEVLSKKFKACVLP